MFTDLCTKYTITLVMGIKGKTSKWQGRVQQGDLSSLWYRLIQSMSSAVGCSFKPQTPLAGGCMCFNKAVITATW